MADWIRIARLSRTSKRKACRLYNIFDAEANMTSQAKAPVTGADSIVIQGIAYEIVRRDAQGDGIEAMFLRRPSGKRFYLTYAKNGVASRVVM